MTETQTDSVYTHPGAGVCCTITKLLNIAVNDFDGKSPRSIRTSNKQDQVNVKCTYILEREIRIMTKGLYEFYDIVIKECLQLEA